MVKKCLQSLGFDPPKPLAGAIEQRKRKQMVCNVSVSSFTNAWVLKSPNRGDTSISLKETCMKKSIDHGRPAEWAGNLQSGDGHWDATAMRVGGRGNWHLAESSFVPKQTVQSATCPSPSWPARKHADVGLGVLRFGPAQFPGSVFAMESAELIVRGKPEETQKGKE